MPIAESDGSVTKLLRDVGAQEIAPLPPRSRPHSLLSTAFASSDSVRARQSAGRLHH